MIKLKSVTAGYHKKPVIHDIDLNFEKEKITVVIGPNGCGKSTLMRAIVGLCDIYAGKIYLGEKEKDIIGHKEFSKQVSYLPQSHSGGAITVSRMVLHGRFPHLSYPRHYSSKDYQYCEQAMDRAGILPIRDRMIDELSGGQRQKVYIAMALAGEMGVYLFDEPTTYLDVKYQLELLDMMKELKAQRKTIIAVLHDLDYAMQIADQVIVMDQGRKLFQGTPEEVFKSGLIEQVFQVKTKILTDADGARHLFFERQT